MRTAYLVENTLFTTDLAENRVLFTSATSFTLKRRALLPSSETSETPCESWSHLFVNLYTGGFMCSYQLPLFNTRHVVPGPVKSGMPSWKGPSQRPSPSKPRKLWFHCAGKDETVSMHIDEKMRPRFTWRFRRLRRGQMCSLF
jgi:hypothetical protein